MKVTAKSSTWLLASQFSRGAVRYCNLWRGALIDFSLVPDPNRSPVSTRVSKGRRVKAKWRRYVSRSPRGYASWVEGGRSSASISFAGQAHLTAVLAQASRHHALRTSLPSWIRAEWRGVEMRIPTTTWEGNWVAKSCRYDPPLHPTDRASKRPVPFPEGRSPAYSLPCADRAQRTCHQISGHALAGP